MRTAIPCLSAAVTIALSGCVSGEAPEAEASRAAAPTAGEIVLEPRKSPRPDGVGCEIEVFATYPSDMPAQTRELTFSEAGSSFMDQLATIELPRPANDPRPVDNADGTTSMRMYQFTLGQCRPVAMRFEIGSCQSGPCLPMRVSPTLPDGFTVEVVR